MLAFSTTKLFLSAHAHTSQIRKCLLLCDESAIHISKQNYSRVETVNCSFTFSGGGIIRTFGGGGFGRSGGASVLSRLLTCNG
jgi:hypothetical protein